MTRSWLTTVIVFLILLAVVLIVLIVNDRSGNEFPPPFSPEQKQIIPPAQSNTVIAYQDDYTSELLKLNERVNRLESIKADIERIRQLEQKINELELELAGINKLEDDFSQKLTETDGSPEPQPETSDDLSDKNVIRVEAYIEGRRQLILHESTAVWRNMSLMESGLLADQNRPTMINGDEWYPRWPDWAIKELQGFGNPGNIKSEKSKAFDEIYPELPAYDEKYSIRKIEARGEVKIAEQPTEENDYKLVIDFDDDAQGGSANYIVEVFNENESNLYKIEALIDGHSQLIIQGYEAQWNHITWAKPGLHGGANKPTLINDEPWMPDWTTDNEDEKSETDESKSLEIEPEKSLDEIENLSSETYNYLDPAIPFENVSYGISILNGRGLIKIIQQPRQENYYTLIVEFNDESYPMGDQYVVDIYFPAEE